MKQSEQPRRKPLAAPVIPPLQAHLITGATFDRRGWHALSHLPDAGSGPFWADRQILRRPLAFTREVAQRCGPVSRTVIGGQPQVLLLSATALETVLLDRDRVFSAAGGWSALLGSLFPRGLLLRDGDEHRHHRRLMLPGMRREALEGYLRRMIDPVQSAVSRWMQDGALTQMGLPAMRRMALSRAADLLLALTDPREVDQAESDFAALVEASTALIRLPLLGRRYARGLKARSRLVAQLMSLTRRRRANPGPDLLSQLCEARDEEGHQLQDEEIVDHLVFLMMAAHDTTASALSSALGLLAQHPKWQEALREESLRQDTHAPVMEQLQARHVAGRIAREVLRLNPPVALLQRRTLRATEVDGQPLPAGARLTLVPLHVQRDAQWWAQPDEFDPDRFNPNRFESVDHRRQAASTPAPVPTPHPYAWTPFGGGVHLCLGQHLADAQMRLVLGQLARCCRWSLPTGTTARWRHAPITQPEGDMPLQLTAI